MPSSQLSVCPSIHQLFREPLLLAGEARRQAVPAVASQTAHAEERRAQAPRPCAHISPAHAPLFPSPSPGLCSHAPKLGTHSPAARQPGAPLPSPRGTCVGLWFLGSIGRDVFGRPSCLGRSVSQQSFMPTSPTPVLIRQSVGFLYTYSSVFVSGEIAFVFLCLLINPSVDLWPKHPLTWYPVWKFSWGMW